MGLTKKRSWSTANGDSKPLLDVLGTLDVSPPQADNRSPIATFTALNAIHHDYKIEASAESGLRAACAQKLLDDVHSLKSGTQLLDVPAELEPVDKGVPRKTPLRDVPDTLNSRETYETPSIEEAGSPLEVPRAATVCYGQITNAFAKLFPISQPLSASALQHDSLYSIRIRSDGVTLCDTDAQEVAELDRRNAEIIKSTKTQMPSLKCEALLCIDEENIGDIPKKASRMVVACMINLYGPIHDAGQVGAYLGKSNLFLQEPTFLPPSVLYCNPHVYSTREEALTPFFISRQSQNDRHFDQEINNILLQTNHDASWSEFEQDSRIKSTLEPHQLAALKFMLRRENVDGQPPPPTMWKLDGRSNRLRYIHKLTRERKETMVNECVGGLLADEMGLGKSLSLLALIVHTLEDAQRFKSDSHDVSPLSLPRVGATLIVTPYSTLSNWQTGMSKHIDAGTLRTYVHHGQMKTRFLSESETAQVVLTTYETIASGSRSISCDLRQFSWFRIVLDEAHWIRNRSTQVFQALHDFDAQRRWCLTGTPVQNGLSDLSALTRWLRFYPFDTSRGFRKFITDPLFKRKEAGLANLRQMTEVFQIRRVKAGMNLGSIALQTISVSLPNQERRNYELVKSSILQSLVEECDAKYSKRATAILPGILKLRRLCCDGLSERTLPTHRLHAMTCNQCGRSITEAAGTTMFHGQCGHVLCDVCCTDCSPDGLEQANGEPCCPICGSIKEDFTQLGDSDVVSAYTDFTPATTFSLGAAAGRYAPAKIAAVTSKLLALHLEPSEAHCKSLVFSYWKHTLAFLESEMQYHSIRCVRIDGDRSEDQRDKALSAFRTDPEVRVIFLTFGTGSMGLTLTEATHVHLVEPHWNPMAEEQAIARAHRIGQNKLVTVWRYIVEDSIEENIVRKQKQKLYLAKIAQSNDESQPGTGGTTGRRAKQSGEGLDDLLEACHLLQG